MMTKEDIKKAFDICFSAQKSCNGCPLLVLEKQNGRGCKYNLFTSVFDLVTEQEKEIERLKAENEELSKVVSSKVYDLIDNTKEIADARKAWEKQAKIEAVKEFAEKLKTRFEEKEQHYICMYDWNGHSAVVDCANEVDELLKEYEK